MPQLFLASQSRSRRMLLDLCRIEYKVVPQFADETDLPQTSLQQIVQQLAQRKMAAVVLPVPQHNNEICFVLTADTLGENSAGELCQKPLNLQHAIKMLRSYRAGTTTATGFCVERRVAINGSWQTVAQIINSASATYRFDVPDHLIASYLDLGFSGISYLNVSGAVEVERYGLQFLRDIQGSYTAIVGLPMFEVRQALEEIRFN